MPAELQYTIIVRGEMGLFRAIHGRISKVLPRCCDKGSRGAIVTCHGGHWYVCCVPRVDRTVGVVRIKIDVNARDKRVVISECRNEIRIVLGTAQPLELGPAFVSDL